MSHCILITCQAIFLELSLNVISNEQNLCAIQIYQFYDIGLSDVLQDRTEDNLRVR